MSTRTLSPQFSLIIVALVTLLSAGTLACSGNKEPKQPAPAQTTTQVSPQLEPPPQLPPPVRRVRPTRPSTVTVIDPGDPDDEPKTLYEASQLAKEIEQQGGPGAAVAEITDENLHEYSASAEVIVLEGDPSSAAPTVGSSLPLTESERDEQYWRNGVLELRMGWRRTLDTVADLELESAALRQQFYAEEDPYVRDNQIKPAWDRVLDRLSQLRDRADHYEQQVDRFVEEGRRGGAEPGWLSEGWELEPPSEDGQPEAFEVHKAMDPPTGVPPAKNPGGVRKP